MKKSRPKIAVDLTPMLPDAENGGAKILVLELLKQFGSLAQEWDFTLLTPESCDQLLASLDRDNMQRRCVLARPTPAVETVGSRLRSAARALASRVPPAVATKLIDVYWSIAHRQRKRSIVDELGANLLFNPFTAPFYRSSQIPSVSIVYDLQHATYPQFFSPEERYGRAANLRAAAEGASKLICISDYVRSSVLEELDVPPEQVVTVPIQLAQRLPSPPASEVAEVTIRYTLERDRYLLYPANFWPHKNHRMLLLAFRQFIERNPSTELKLVCTGQPGRTMSGVIENAARMGLAAHCRFPGFVSDKDLAALLQGCRALIFPSLYEGFGMPILEAMEHGRPILSSDRTALPEVGGDALLYFDPRRPADIAAAIEKIDTDAALCADLAQRSRIRRSDFAAPNAMASRYLDIFAEAMGSNRPDQEERAGSDSHL